MAARIYNCNELYNAPISYNGRPRYPDPDEVAAGVVYGESFELIGTKLMGTSNGVKIDLLQGKPVLVNNGSVMVL